MGLGRSGELGYTVGVRINGASSKYGEKVNSSGKMKVCARISGHLTTMTYVVT